jgi:hypothetical protein
MEVLLDRFSAFYNVRRPHQALGGLTPSEAWDELTLRHVQTRNANHRRDPLAIWLSLRR